MAHVLKIKQGAVAPLVAHYERMPELERGFTRGNIDPGRIKLNYNLRPSDVRQEVGLAIAQHEQESGKGIRKDANVLLDWVVTLPHDCPPERTREFFESVAEFMEGRYGKGNVLGCYVHMDETTPHAHIPILPMRDGKLVASKVVTRRDLQTFHGDLGKHVDAALGMHVSIELSEEQRGEKQLSHLSQDEYVAAKRRLECLQQRAESEAAAVAELDRAIEQAELQPPAESLAESARTLCKARGDGEREEALAGEVEGLRSALRASEGECERLGERARELERGLPLLRARCERARERFERAERGVAKLVSQLREIPNTVSEWAQDIARKLGKRVYDPRSLDYQVRQATEAARAYNRSRGADSPRRDWHRADGRDDVL